MCAGAQLGNFERGRRYIYNRTGVYIGQNTMARGGGEMVPGKKMKNEAVGNKMKKKEKGKRKKGKGKRRKGKGGT